MQRALRAVCYLAIAAYGCGGDVSESVATTGATYEPIRSSATARRVRFDERLAMPGLGRLTLDTGPSLIVSEAEAELGLEALTLHAGRAYVEVLAGDSLELRVGEGTLVLGDAACSVTVGGEVYVLRGEVAYRQGDARLLVHAGERLDLGSGRVEPAALWEDWTAGLAQPGPGIQRDVAIGALEARVPDELGQARWPLVIRSLDVKVRVIDDLAITEVEQVFFNPASEMVEGIYRIRVPAGAVLQRFAVDRDGRLVDGYVREKAQAAAAYEAQVFAGSMLDPALLEWVDRGTFKARIYPIQPGDTRRIVIRYAEWLERPFEGGHRVYRFPMSAGAGAPQVQEFSLEADLRQAKATRIGAGFGATVDGDVVRLRRSDFRPRADFVMELEDAAGRASSQPAWRATHVAPRRDPRAGAMPDEDTRDYLFVPLRLPDTLFGESAEGIDMVIVADVSAATDPSHLELGRSVVEALVAHLGEHDRVAIAASDVGLRTIGGDDALGPKDPARIEALLDALAREPAGGASDLGAALSQAAAKLDPARPGLVVYVGDGAPTVGELGAEELLERLERLPHPLRSYAVAVGGDAQLELLESVTRGGGLALRVESRAAAADAALALLAHARRPVAQRVTVELDGVDQLFPRRPSDVVRGAVMPIVARVEGSPSKELLVRGQIAGQPFEERIALTEARIGDEGDLRMRWAGERLHQLLLGGAQRAEIADLGIRYGLITPFTSFYVPSAAELAALGPAGAHLREDMDVFASRRGPVFGALAAPLAWITTAMGCNDMTLSRSEPPPPPGSEWSAREQQGQNEAEDMEAAEEAPEEPASAAVDLPVEAEPSAAPAPAPVIPAQQAPVGATATSTPGRSPSTGYYGPSGGEADGRDGDFERNRGGSAEQPSPDPEAPRAAAATRSNLDGSRRSGGGGADTSALDDLLAGAMIDQAGALAAVLGADRVRERATTTELELSLRVRFDDRAHRTQRCSDASDLLLDRRIELWRERLGRAGGAAGWVGVYHAADRACELTDWGDRRALLDLILAQAGSIAQMVSVYNLFETSSVRNYLRRAILRKVRTPDELRIVRGAFGASAADDEIIRQVLARAPEGPARLRALRRLVQQLPQHVDLKLQLLEALERAGLVAELRRLASKLRVDPMTDAGIRTAIGEMFLRQDDEPEARRVFSEIVEFAPEDALARRRLGDLYRAHGWFEDAYRQYVTLSEIVPDDPTVLLLLAQAAAGAGRIDEALRLEQRLAETAQPGAAEGIARIALLWSSVRFAELRQAARASSDQEELDALASRMRRSGVMGNASALRVTLVWSHPEAGLSLWASHPGLGLARPTDIAPELGLEAFDVDEQESGAYQLEVRRPDVGLTAVEARLVVVWNEGADDEQIEVLPLRFEGERKKVAYRLEGRTLREVSP